MASSFPPRVGTVFAERYQLRELLGSGGVGQVFRAWDVQAQRLVAIKAFNPAGVSPTTWAAYAELVAKAQSIRHPDLVLPQGLPAALPPSPVGVMESLVGEDLATLRARLGRVPWQRAAEIGARVAEILHGVQAATGVAHRDLKATNVFVPESGAVKLLDYGVAEFDVQSADRTRVDSALGIVDYKAPEQLETNVGGYHADVFSLAVLVFEMIAGERPFSGASYFIVARKILLEPAPSLAEVAPEAGAPPALDALLQRALAKRPADRFTDLQAMQRAFTELLRGGSRAPRAAGRPGATPAPPPRPAPRPSTVRPAPPPDETPTLQPPPRGARKPGIRQPTGRLKEMVPTGARAVVQAGDGSDVGRVSETVVAMSPTGVTRGSIPDSTVVYPHNIVQADRKVVLVDPNERGVRPEELDDETLLTQVHPREDDPPRAMPAERTMILGDEGGPARPEATLMLPDDAAAAGLSAPQPERTMMIPDEPDPRAGGTMQLPEGTMQLSGEKGPGAGWTLQKTLILINVACGVLILLGLLVLVLGGDDPALVQEK